ncbi:MAG: tRNA pseudouridine(38-40) synthase TruA [Calditerrivibrio sp.]|nr:tRNA pseudouridine(38-40) synthase TruA [Calditerrivibrio sp.]
MLYNKKCTVEYDGTDFHGWQYQKDLVTIQSEIESALFRIYKKRINIIGSGRTDAGVHAIAQVFNFRSDKYINCESLKLGLNSLLPRSIIIKKVEDVALDFHAQKSAISKTYLYKILNSDTPSAFLRHRVWWIRNRIDLEYFYNIISIFVGTHDFSAMCTMKSIKENPVRTINFIKLYAENDIVNIEINANGFLHNMVRNIIGTTFYIYRKQLTPETVMDILASKDRKKAGPTAPPQGLYLKEVFYPDPGSPLDPSP